jgi:integrase
VDERAVSVHNTNKDGSGRWFCRFSKGTLPDQPNATRRYFGRGPQAEAAAWRFNEQIGLGARRVIGGITFSLLASNYLSSKLGKIERSSIATIVYHIEKHLMGYFGSRDIEAITPTVVDGYVARRLSQKRQHGNTIKVGVTRSTVRRELATFQAIMNWGVRNRCVSHNPAQYHEKPKEDDAVIAPATKAEIAAIMQAAAPHLRRFLVIAYHTGARPGAVELLSLKWEHVDFVGRTIFVTSARKGGLVSRMVPMNDALFAALVQYYEQDKEHDYIIHYRGQPIRCIRNAWTIAKKKAKILRRLRLYDIRHASVTDMLESGADLKSVAAIVGHANPSMTMKRYQHNSMALARAAVSGLVTNGNEPEKEKGSKSNTGA